MMCKQELNKAIILFRVRAGGSTLSQIGNVKKDAKQQHDELMALINAHPDLSSSGRSPVIGTLSSSGNSSGSFSLLPASPNIFHGHELKLKDAVNVLLQNSTCVAILAHIGLEKGSKMAIKIAHYFAHAPPSLLVLDNLETTWEALSSRSEVEEFLSLLTDVPQLAPMPLSNVAAWQTFIEVADEGHDDTSIKELLELTGNLPLAVSLIGSVSGSEGCAKALSRWKLERTRMLSDGYDQRSSLDISIMLSYTSSRMTPGAQELLSILSLLPDGLADADLVQAQLQLPDILACKATLIQTSLAFVGQDQHLKVLVPIREHIISTHPPREPLKLKLWEHFHQILDLWNQFKDLDVTNIHPQISQNLDNFNGVLQDGVESERPDIVQNIRSILFLNQFCDRVQHTYSPLLPRLSGKMLHWKGHPIFGEYLIQLLEISGYLPDLDFKGNITLGTQHFESKDTVEQGETQSVLVFVDTNISPARWYRALGIYFHWAKSDLVGALQYYQRAYALAESIGYPTTVGIRASIAICNILIYTGKPLSALTHAKEAYRYAEQMGNIYLQTWSLGLCHLQLANYWQAQCLMQKTRHSLATLGSQQSALWLYILGHQAEIHLVKSEYLQSRKLQVGIASSCQPTSYNAILATLNIACIDVATGSDSKIIHQNLDMAQSHLRALYGYYGRHLCLTADLAAAELRLRDGALETTNPYGAAREMFKKCFEQSQDISADLALLCLERLGDLSTSMNDIQIHCNGLGSSLYWL
ncbi:hypothetical protein C8J57DRAFT_1572342 [Mycena rebaudengoi]|nr:hypothetical protein C8J57DRAFT_1572342 [Mycena rebaudengoi]